MAIPSVNAQDINGTAIAVGTIVNIRCVITSITNGGVGAGAAVNVSVETPGLVGQRSASFTVSPSQCRKATANSQL